MLRHPTIVSSSVPIPADAPITWIGGRPLDEETRVVCDAITREQVTRYAALVEHVGERLFRRDLQSVSTAADLGFFRPFYLAHARALLAALDGTLLRIGGPGAS
jgi:H2-forming N5,N10-methylenetetrahydromethanopterin dehydrogenase-like enzyme